MATRQQYLDDLERRMMVDATGFDGGKKTYAVRGPVPVPAFDPKPYDPLRMSAAEWRDSVLQNFRGVYLEWWFNAFETLRAEMAGREFADRRDSGPVHNPETGLFEAPE